MTSSDGDAVLNVVTDRGAREVRGTLLGKSSSRVDSHNHPEGENCPPYRRCSACRWTEITVLRRGDGQYVLVNEGLSRVSGEVAYARVSVAASAEDAVQRLYRVNQRGRDPLEPFLPQVARKALLHASDADPDIRESMRSRGFIG